MILGMSVGAFTILHVIITLIAIGSGLIVVGGMFASDRPRHHRLDRRIGGRYAARPMQPAEEVYLIGWVGYAGATPLDRRKIESFLDSLGHDR